MHVLQVLVVNRELRRALIRAGYQYELVEDHCEDCGSPMCPVCRTHTVWCPICGAYECPEGCWEGFATAAYTGGAWPVI